MEQCIKKEVNNIEVYILLKRLELSVVPPIIKIEDNNIIYKFINGSTLQELLDNDIRIPHDIIVNLIKALNIISQHSIVHKDIKPDNIIVESITNKVYLIDFGVSRIHDGNKERDTTLFGTTGYASPEHYGYQETTYLSDIYSLGKVLEQVNYNEQYQKIIDRCTKIDPKQRYNNYVDILKAIDKSQKKIDKEPKIEMDQMDFEKKVQYLIGFNNNNSHTINIICLIFASIFGFYIFSECRNPKSLEGMSTTYFIIIGFFSLALVLLIIDGIHDVYLILRKQDYKKYGITLLRKTISFLIIMLIGGIITGLFNIT